MPRYKVVAEEVRMGDNSIFLEIKNKILASQRSERISAMLQFHEDFL